MYTTEFIYGARLEDSTSGRAARVWEFLRKMGLHPDSDTDLTVYLVNENGDIAATGSIFRNVLKFIAVDEKEQGTGAAASVVSELVNYAYHESIYKLFLFTKPEKEVMFHSLGFYTLAKTEHALIMENERTGLTKYLSSLKRPEGADDSSRIGAIVANCNPMTLGHMYLMETAAREVDFLHVFILSEDRSMFPAKTRYDIVCEATAHIKNLLVQRASDYIISSATFPTYFIKERGAVQDINADLDLTLFAERIAPALGITTRFVGTEPFCAVTSAYNERMKAILPAHGITVREIERKDAISASRVRELMESRDMDAIRAIVPDATYRRIEEMLKY